MSFPWEQAAPPAPGPPHGVRGQGLSRPPSSTGVGACLIVAPSIARADATRAPSAPSAPAASADTGPAKKIVTAYTDSLKAVEDAQAALAASQRGLKCAVMSSLRLVPGWCHVQSEGDFSMDRISGALTNLIFHCTTPAPPGTAAQHNRHAGGDEVTEQHVLVRLYGNGTERFFSRQQELASFRVISDARLGPRLLHVFDGGRLEEWIVGAVPFTPSQMRDPELSVKVAARLAGFHRIAPPAGSAGAPMQSIVFSRAQQWLRLALSLCSPSHVARCRLSELEQDLCALRPLLPPSMIVFGHNDLQHGNVLIRKGKGKRGNKIRKVNFVDFEYCGPVERGFDIGNFWCEWASDFGSDEPHKLHFDRFPQLAEQRAFCTAYLRAGNKAAAPPSPAAVKALCNEAKQWSVMSHAWWGLWGLVQAATSSIDFDFAEYSAQRFEQYWSAREQHK